MRLVGDFRLALTFLTRLPVPIGAEAAARGSLARAMWAFPLVGVVTGGIGGGVFIAVIALGLPAFTASIIAVASMIAATGALHEDGLADMADASGGTTRERKLEIMRDSRIGTYGVVALCLALLLKVSTLSAYASVGGGTAALLLLISAGAASRAAILLPAYVLPNARETGLSALAGRPANATLAVAIALALIIAFAALPLHVALAGLAGCALGVVAVIAAARHQLGGQTGDVLGACQQMAELGFLLGALVAIG